MKGVLPLLAVAVLTGAAPPATTLPVGEAARAQAVATAGDDSLNQAALVLCDAHPDYHATDRLAELRNVPVFDDLWFAGIKGVSAWVWRHGDDYAVIDALDNAQEAQEHIVALLDRYGIERKAVKLVIVTHGHRDHSGGVSYLLSALPNARLAITADAHKVAADAAAKAGETFPAAGIVLRDGMRLAGTMRAYETPGHSPGTVSLIFPIHGRKVHYMATLMGGSASFRLGPADLEAYSRSAERLGTLADRAGVDVILSNHPVLDQSRAWTEAGTVPPRDARRTRAQVRAYYRVVDLCARSHMQSAGPIAKHPD